MHDNARHTLSTLPDPVEGEQSRFWDEDTQFTIQPHFERWIVFRHRSGRATPLVTLHRTADGWRASEVNGADQWTGGTVASVLEPQL